MQPNNYITGHPDSLPSFLLAGEVHVPAPNKHFQRTTKDWIIYVITDGTMQISEGEQTYTLTAGDIMIFSPDRCHFGHLTNDHIDYYYIHFQWESLRDISMSTEAYLQAMNRHPFSPEISSRQEPLLLPKYFHPAHASFRGILQQTQYLVKDSSRNFLHQQKKMMPCYFCCYFICPSRNCPIFYTQKQTAHPYPFRFWSIYKQTTPKRSPVLP